MSLISVNHFVAENLFINTIPIICLFLGVAEVFFFHFSKLSSSSKSSTQSQDSQKIEKNQVNEPVSSSDDHEEEDGNIEVGDMEIVMGKLGLFYQPDEGQRLGCDDIYSLFEQTKPSLEEIKSAFDVFDGNKDGFIDAEELQRVICELGFQEGLELENCKRMIGNFDENGDGRIEFEEFIKFIEIALC